MYSKNLFFSNAIFSFSQTIRVERWWLYKTAPLLGIVYLFIVIKQPDNPVLLISCFLSVIMGIGGLGYIVNDYYDRESDRAAGKKNVFESTSSRKISLTVFVLLLLSIVPWIFLPYSKLILFLLCLQSALYFLYSHPATRLKGIAPGGIICDTLYGHLIPFLVISLSLQDCSTASFNKFTVFLAAGFAWQIFKGIRNIILHQIDDRKNDTKSGLKTFTVHYGAMFSARIINFIIMPLEIISFTFFLWAVSLNISSFYLVFIAFLVFTVFARGVWRSWTAPSPRDTKNLLFFLNDFYEIWMPVAALIFLCFANGWFIPLLMAHLFLFRNMFGRIREDLLDIKNNITGLLLFCCLIFGVSCTKPQPAKREFHLETDTPAAHAICIHNNGNSTAEFKLKLNRFFPATINEITDSIIMTPDGDILNGDWVKTWSFVSSCTIHSYPLSGDDWYHSPELILNSTGFGFCDDRANILARLWKQMGYQARVWGLSGHVVPEVNKNGRWEMYDPSIGVFFKKPDGQVAGVEEIASTPDILSNYTAIDSVHSLLFRMGKNRLKEIYSSTENNQMNRMSDSSDKPVDTGFILPPGAQLIFPAKYFDTINVSSGRHVHRFANAKLTLPPAPEQAICIPLVIAAISGKGTARIRGKEYVIRSAELNKKITEGGIFSEKVYIKNPDDTVEIFFFINPLLARLSKSNTLAMEGYNIEKTDASLPYLNPGFRLRHFLEDTLSQFLLKNDKAIKEIGLLKNRIGHPLRDQVDFFLLLKEWVNRDKNLTDVLKKQKIKTMEERFVFFLSLVIPPPMKTMILSILNEPDAAWIALKILESNSNEEIALKFKRYSCIINKSGNKVLKE